MPPPQHNPQRPTPGSNANADRQPPTPPETIQEPADAPQGDPQATEVKSPSAAPRTAPPASQESGKKFDETVPGGQYMVGGKLVDADGKPIDKKKKSE